MRERCNHSMVCTRCGVQRMREFRGDVDVHAVEDGFCQMSVYMGDEAGTEILVQFPVSEDGKKHGNGAAWVVDDRMPTEQTIDEWVGV